MSTRFEDGPATPVMLELKRSPKFLRVVFSASRPGNGWDALAAVDDRPRHDDLIYAYVRVADRGSYYTDQAGKGRRKEGPFRMATYRIVEHQPDAATMHDNDDWQEWCWAELELEIREAQGG